MVCDLVQLITPLNLIVSIKRSILWTAAAAVMKTTASVLNATKIWSSEIISAVGRDKIYQNKFAVVVILTLKVLKVNRNESLSKEYYIHNIWGQAEIVQLHLVLFWWILSPEQLKKISLSNKKFTITTALML